jgi:hypothetical protein
MNSNQKIIYILFLLIFGIIIIACLLNFENKPAEFFEAKISTNFQGKKPILNLDDSEIDSLKKIVVSEPKLEIVGDGYNGYVFYFWHKPETTGEIYIKGYEATKNIPLTYSNLEKNTLNKIKKGSENHELFKGESIISEGTMGKYFPARFEVWFKSKNNNQKKVMEKLYIIDGWDR